MPRSQEVILTNMCLIEDKEGKVVVQIRDPKRYRWSGVAFPGGGGGEFANDILVDFKKVISSELTPYASFILLDAEYGATASELLHADCEFIAAYEKTEYEASTPGR